MGRSAPVRHPEVVHRELEGGQVVLLHLDSGAYHEINPVGALIWELLDGDRGPSQIAGELRERVDDPPENLDDVVSDFLTELHRRNLVT